MRSTTYNLNCLYFLTYVVETAGRLEVDMPVITCICELTIYEENLVYDKRSLFVAMGKFLNITATQLFSGPVVTLRSRTVPLTHNLKFPQPPKTKMPNRFAQTC